MSRFYREEKVMRKLLRINLTDRQFSYQEIQSGSEMGWVRCTPIPAGPLSSMQTSD
jgi:hypothetical protein